MGLGYFYAAFIFILGVVGCTMHPNEPEEPVAGADHHGIYLEHFDLNTPPERDFYRFVNGSWLDNTLIPEDKSDYGIFTLLQDQARERIHDLIEPLVRTAEVSAKQEGDAGKIRNLYLSFMDTKSIEKRRFQALVAESEAIDKLRSKKGLPHFIADQILAGIEGPFSIYAAGDFKNPEYNGLWISQSGLGLHDRDLYFKKDRYSETLRNHYQKTIRDIFAAIGAEHPADISKGVYELEEQLATISLSGTQLRQKDRIYNPISVDDIDHILPPLGFKKLIKKLKLGHIKSVIVTSPEYLKGVSALFRNRPLSVWKNYFRWQLLVSYGEYLHAEVAELHFEFFEKRLRGIQQQQSRQERAVDLVNHSLADAIGQRYVAKYFSLKSKEKVGEMVEGLRSAFRQSFEKLDWMSPSTRKKAIEKLEGFTARIGFPDSWRDYSTLRITADDLVGNLIRVARFDADENLAGAGKKLDRKKWLISPQTVNAYYSPVRNEIVFPAAILQPPFFDPRADDAINYGGIGAVIGHEMGHGFDDQGSRFDSRGRMRNWWSREDQQEFKKRTATLVRQYGGYEPVKGHKLNGAFTLGENIGDLGGLSIAYRAYRLAAYRKGEKEPLIAGFSGNQRFFIGWAQVWPRLYRKEELIRRITTDPHSPSEYRVNGVLSNMPEFHEAFGVKATDPMHTPPEQRVKIW